MCTVSAGRRGVEYSSTGEQLLRQLLLQLLSRYCAGTTQQGSNTSLFVLPLAWLIEITLLQCICESMLPWQQWSQLGFFAPGY